MHVGDKGGTGEDVVHNTRPTYMGEVVKVLRLEEPSNVVKNQNVMGLFELKKEPTIANEGEEFVESLWNMRG